MRVLYPGEGLDKHKYTWSDLFLAYMDYFLSNKHILKLIPQNIFTVSQI